MLAGAVIPRNSNRAIQDFCNALAQAMGARVNERDYPQAELCFRAAAAIGMRRHRSTISSDRNKHRKEQESAAVSWNAPPGFEVIEIGCPSDHMTCIDHDMPLPNGRVDPERVFNGQRFVWHQADKVAWQAGRLEGLEVRNIGIAAATDGLASAQVWRLGEGVTSVPAVKHAAEFVIYFVLEDSVTLKAEGHGTRALGAGDSFVIPEGMVFGMEGASEDLELQEVALAAEYGFEVVKSFSKADILSYLAS